MDNKALYSKTVRYQRVAVKNTFSLLSTLQDHGERLLKKSLEQNPWLPEKSKKACACLADTCFNSSKLLEKIVDRNFSDIEKLYRTGDKPQKKQTQPKKTEASKPARTEEKSSEVRTKTASPVKTGGRATPPARGGGQKRSPKPEQPPAAVSTVADTLAPVKKDIKEAEPKVVNIPQTIPPPDKAL
jgi:hypothetical protein